MLPSHHAAAALATAPLLARGWSRWKVAQFAAAAVLIDADHYASYVWRIRDLSLRRAYWFHRRKVDHGYRLHRPALALDPHRPLHAPALLLLLLLLARRLPAVRPVVAGMVFHRLLDYAYSGWHIAGLLGRRAYAGTAYSKTLK